ncbi:MAG: MFS transporter [Chitinophagales bacterium]|nr:MFS transporter [Chitinophagales bacterium]
MKSSSTISLLLIANAISGISQGITMLAVPWYFTGIINQEGLFGDIYFVVTLVSLFWGVYSGTLIDRYNRKSIFLIMNIAGLFILGGVSAYGYFYQELPWLLAGIPFAATAFIYNLHFPNLYAFAQEITPKKDYVRVTSLLEIQGQISFTVAGGVAAILLQGLDGSGFHFLGFSFLENFKFKPVEIWTIFGINSFTYLVAFAIIYNIKSFTKVKKGHEAASLKKQLEIGFSFLHKNPLLLRFGVVSLLLFLTVIVFGTQLSPMYVKLFLERGGDAFAISDMTFSIGALLAGVFTARIFKQDQNISSLIALNAIAGFMYLAMIATKLTILFYMANFIIGFCNAGVRIQRITYIFHHVPNEVIGRAGSVFFVVNILMRLMLIGLFALPFFHTPTTILYPIILLAVICVSASMFLLKDYKKLIEVK